jgi:hypothetical protein
MNHYKNARTRGAKQQEIKSLKLKVKKTSDAKKRFKVLNYKILLQQGPRALTFSIPLILFPPMFLFLPKQQAMVKKKEEEKLN